MGGERPSPAALWTRAQTTQGSTTREMWVLFDRVSSLPDQDCLQPTSLLLDDSLLSGCALAIANVDNIEDVTMDNLVVFSTQAECVKQKETYFDIPAMMPACDGEHCGESPGPRFTVQSLTRHSHSLCMVLALQRWNRQLFQCAPAVAILCHPKLTRCFAVTGFDCNVTGSNPLATAIAAPQDPTFCMPGNTTCVTTSGAKRPLYAYK